jgi:hypothetical protein
MPLKLNIIIYKELNREDSILIKKNKKEELVYIVVPTLTPIVGRTFIELQADKSKVQITTVIILFMQ